MTLHNAKGLEYRAVFIIGCEDGLFPHSRSIDEGDLEEERRLAYVGLTRARERLTLTHARRRSIFGAAGTGIPSRFLGEIPDGLVERHSTVGPATGWGVGSGSSGFGGAGGSGFSAPAAAAAPSRPWSWRSATTSSTPPSARASSPRSSPATSSSSASPAPAASAS